MGSNDARTPSPWRGHTSSSPASSSGAGQLAQKTIPMGTAYAVWTGIGAVGAFLLGLAFFGEAASTARFLFVGLIIMGIIGLKVSS